ncbi:hypothetical protein FEM48_Zijuj02G0036400 [Ziziphus jujuba var. spinosa]|uniref:Uncharacterized protein n=1 Tax=Ziziphus jujuba var. spinosa TaxID=714518 RepID=A0A978VTE5_ZIZJJ|nr:hypothetical protein FEM48_Zijuj02G0036400 [Ziziphus jujuba var. spinosa]
MGPGDNVIEYLQHGRITINILFKAMKISSKSTPIAYHSEEEAMKKLEKKQFPWHTRFSDNTEEVKSLHNGFTLEPEYSMPINFKFRVEFWSIYGFMPNYQKQGRIVLDILFNAKIRPGFASWKSLPRSINIDCSNLVVFTGRTFKPTVCKVDY